MIEWLKDWTNSIIVAVIIAVIFELIIPNGNNKKYIKMVIGLYILFTILNPLISKFTNLNGINVNAKDYEKYFKNGDSLQINASLDSEKLINNTAQRAIMDNIEKKLNEHGYKATITCINIDSSTGKIEDLKLKVEKEELNTDKLGYSKNNLTININQINEVNISNKNSNNKNEGLRKSDIKIIKKIINEEYGITEENIEIN